VYVGVSLYRYTTGKVISYRLKKHLGDVHTSQSEATEPLGGYTIESVADGRCERQTVTFPVMAHSTAPQTVVVFQNKGTISKFCRARFLIFVLVFVSRDFELGTNVSCEELTVSPARG